MSDDTLDLLAALVLEDGRRWGEAAAPTQWEDARAVLDATGVPYHFLTRARGWSKTTDLAGIALAVMLTDLTPGSSMYALAADRDQGRLLIDAIRGFSQRTPGLRDAIRVESYRVIATTTETTLEVLAADAAGSYGLRPAFLIVDELAQWPDTPSARRLWEATSSAMTKVPDARMVVLTSAGDPAHWSYSVYEHAREDPLWRLHELAGPPPWIDPERLAEQRRRLPATSFQRLFLNQWTAGDDRLTDPEDIRACITHVGNQPPRPNTDYVIGVDLGLNNDATVAAVCHLAEFQRDVNGQQLTSHRVTVDRLDVWQGTPTDPVQLADVEDTLIDLSGGYNRALIIIDPWQAVGMAQRLIRARVNVEDYQFTAGSVGRLASTTLGLFRTRLFALPDDPELIDEFINVRVIGTPTGVYRMDHDPGRHDDRATAIALAAQHLLIKPQRRRTRVIR